MPYTPWFRSVFTMLVLVTILLIGTHLPSVVKSASFTSSARSDAEVFAGSSLTIAASVTSETSLAVLLDIEVYTASGVRTYQQVFENRSLKAGETDSVTATWQIPTSQPAGVYTVKIGVFGPGWTPLYHWNDRAITFNVITTDTLTPPSEQRFATLPPGSVLPSGQECSDRLRRSLWEPRPGNSHQNATRPTSTQISELRPWTRNSNGVDDRSDSLRQRIDGQFTGTTDEILQWGACKWGIDEDIVRAVAVQESWWRQQTEGDYNVTTGEYESYGILQVRKTAHTITFPVSRDSTSFNVDFALAWRRACYEGYIQWLNDAQPGAGYQAGDEWGCVGFWFSGRWKDSAANRYIDAVQHHLAEKTWLKPEF